MTSYRVFLLTLRLAIVQQTTGGVEATVPPDTMDLTKILPHRYPCLRIHRIDNRGELSLLAAGCLTPVRLAG